MTSKTSELVLAVHPFTRGFAFALFEAPLSPVDWGIKEFRSGDRNALCLAAFEQLIAQRQPDVVVLLDYAKIPTWPSQRVRRLHRLFQNQAIGRGIEVRSYTRRTIHACFAGTGAVTRYQIAQAIAAQVHAFGHQLPPPRKIWNPEDPRMILFDAASLVMTHYFASDTGEPAQL